MVKIRLRRIGAKKTPFYRVVVTESTSRRDGKPIADLGHYDPKKKVLILDKVAALEWIKKGAQPTETVGYLINKSDESGNLIVKEKTEKKLSKKALAKMEAEREAKAKAEEEAKAKAEEEAKAAAEAVKAEAEVATNAETPAE